MLPAVPDPAVPAPSLPPDPLAAPESMVVPMDTGERIHYLDWGPPGPGGVARPPLVLVHGIAQTAWTWAPVARRLCRLTRVLAVDLRGHGLSETPRSGYDPGSLAYDVLTVMAANGIGTGGDAPPAVVAGHGAGGIVAATIAALRPGSVAGLALVDGGWEDLAEATRMSSTEYLAAIAEPPEVLASMAAFLADRRAFDPTTWDEDQERAARAQVDQKHAGHVALVTRAIALRGLADGMFAYDPRATLAAVACPVVALVSESGATDDETALERRLALEDVERARAGAGRAPARIVRYAGAGHNLMRYRPAEVASELGALLGSAGA
jgi:pimeloyl-ACP methyl ester carboxylesterase